MITFGDLEIENFGSIGKITFPLHKPGLILITGWNKDVPKANSNGSGKSLLFDALCWCLWGITPRDLGSDEVVNVRVGKDCRVRITLFENNHKYVVTRHRGDTRVKKPNDLVLEVDGIIDTAGSMKATQALVDQILGFDFTTFCAMMPGAGVEVAKLTDSQIKGLLERMLQTEMLTKAYEHVRKLFNDMDKEVSILTINEQTTAKQLVDYQQQTTVLQQKADTFDQAKNQKLKALAEKVLHAGEEVRGFDTQILAGIEAIDKVKELGKQADLVSSFTQDLLDGFALFEKSIEHDVHITSANILDLERKIHELSMERDNLQRTKSGVCGICQQEVDAHHAEAEIARRTKYLEMHNSTVQAYRRNIRLLREEALEERTKTDKLVDEYKKEQIDLRAKILELMEVSNKAKIAAGQKQYSLKSIEDLKEEFKKVEKETCPFNDLIKDIEVKAAKLENVYSEIKLKLDTLQKDKQKLEFWVQGFSPKGMRSFMLDYVTPVLNDRAKHYSDILTGGEMTVTFSTKTTLESGEERDKFQISVDQAHGGLSYKASSKGEKARADLVIALALGDLATFRSNKQIPFRFFDECFDSIDEAGSDAIVHLLNEQKNRCSTVFVITHKDSFKQLFSQRMTVIKENGISRLSHE